MTDGQTDGKTHIRTADGYTWDEKDGKIEDHRIDRTGRPPLKFRGICIGEASTHEHQGPRQNRWDAYGLYVTTGGNYVIAHTYNTCWQGENGHTDAAKGATIKEMLKNAAADAMWGPMDDCDYPEVINDLLKDAGLSDEIAENVE